MEDLVRSYYDNYKRVIILLLRPTGMWPSKSRRSIILDVIRPAFSILSGFILVLGCVNFTIHNFRNIILLVVGLRNIFSFSNAWLKVITMAVMRPQTARLNDSLTALFESDLKVPEYRVHLLAYYRSFYRFYKLYFCFGMTMILITMVVPTRAALSGNYVKVQFMHVPFEFTPGGPVHYMVVTFEIVTVIIISITTIGADTAFGMYALQIVGELRLLSHRFRNLSPGPDYKRELKTCIDRHSLLISYTQIINRIFGFVCVWLAVSCAVSICFMIFQIHRMKQTSLYHRFIAIDFVIIKFLQSYTYAYFGNAVTVESEKCMESIYYCEWPVSTDLRFKKDVNIIQSQSLIFINAMGVLRVQMDMFLNIARASISYFFILKTLEEKLS